MNLTYEEWYEEVNEIVSGLAAGFTQDDFTDWCSYDAWADGIEPEEAAIECLENDDIGRQFLAMHGQ